MKTTAFVTLALIAGISAGGTGQPRPVVTGETVRVRAVSGHVTGSVVQITDSILRMDTKSGPTTVMRRDIQSVRRQVRQPFRFNVPLAVAGASTGMIITWDRSVRRMLVTGTIVGLATGILGNAGNGTVPGVVTGGLIGVGAGFFLGLVTSQDACARYCRPQHPMGLAMSNSLELGALGALTGLIIGAAIPGASWNPARLAVTVRPSRNAVRIGLTKHRFEVTWPYSIR